MRDPQRTHSPQEAFWADTKGTWGRIVYQCEFSKAKGTLTIGLRKEGKEWKINKVQYDSPVFLENLLAKPNS